MLSWSALTAFKVLLLLGLPRSLEAAATSSPVVAPTPSPLVVPPSQSWDGNDGPWSSFSLRIGTPPHDFRVMVSTASNQPLVVIPEGCGSSDPSGCPSSRGSLFQSNASTSYYVPSWIRSSSSSDGMFSLGIDSNLGYSGNGLYGYDNVSLGDSLPSLSAQIVGGITTKEFFLGLLGVNPAATNFPDNPNPMPSYLSSLKAQNLIPSLSYAYTAGNQYRFQNAWGSLTLGGVDASLIEPNDLTVAFGPNSELTIDVNTITMSSKSGNSTLASESFPASIDSTVPYLYLPVEVCQQFEEAFGIVYDSPSDLYLVNDTLHTQLLSESASVTFTLTNSTSKVMVDIVLPYQAFDLTAKWPLVDNDTRYFPLKRATNNSQTTLGRSFLQEAYLVADYERSNFSIYQRRWDAKAQADVQPILLPSNTPTDSSSKGKKLSVGVYVAITIGAAVLVTALVAGFFIMRKRYKKTKAVRSELLNLPGFQTPSISLNSISGHKDIEYQPVMVSPSLTYYSGSDTDPLKPVQKYKPGLLSPSFTDYNGTELDAVGTELRSPERGGQEDYFQPLPKRSTNTMDFVHELPARETVDWDRYATRKDLKAPRWV